MAILPPEIPAVTAGPTPPLPLTPPDVDLELDDDEVDPAYQAAYRACENHPAYADAETILAAVDHVSRLCAAFVGVYDEDAIERHLSGLGLASEEFDCDYRCLHRDIAGAEWFLDILRGMIDPNPALPRQRRAVKRGAA